MIISNPLPHFSTWFVYAPKHTVAWDISQSSFTPSYSTWPYPSPPLPPSYLPIYGKISNILFNFWYVFHIILIPSWCFLFLPFLPTDTEMLCIIIYIKTIVKQTNCTSSFHFSLFVNYVTALLLSEIGSLALTQAVWELSKGPFIKDVIN